MTSAKMSETATQKNQLGAPPAVAHWHCPACHRELPERLVVCGHCSFDMRTGKHLVTSNPPAHASFTHHTVRRRHRGDNVLFGIIGVILAVLILLIVVAFIQSHPPSQPVKPNRMLQR